MVDSTNNLLIGGSGFIGSALGRELISRRERVVSVSLSSEGNAPGVNPVIVDLYHQPCPQDILDEADNVFILLGQTHKGFDAAQEKQVLDTLARSLSKGRSRVFYFSTVLVYGHTLSHATETTIPKPLDDYSKFKLEAEAIVTDHIPPERLTILRLANIYGSPKNKGFIGLLMGKLADPNPDIRLNGDGQQRRDFVFIDDLVHAIIAVVNKPSQSGIVNISTGVSHSLIDVIILVSEVSGKNVNYELSRIEVNEPRDSLVDNSRLRKVFGYANFTPLKDGLTKTLQRYSDDAN